MTHSKYIALASIFSILACTILPANETQEFLLEEYTLGQQAPEEHVVVRSRELDARVKERLRNSRAQEEDSEKSPSEEEVSFQNASLSLSSQPQFRLASALMGATGNAGSTGSRGNTGSSGPSGMSGPKGTTGGMTGSRGTTGSNTWGSTGSMGQTGTTSAPQATFTSAVFGFPVSIHMLVDIADNGRSIEIEDGSHWEVSSSDSYILNSWRHSDQLVITPNYSWFGAYEYYIVNKSDRDSSVRANLWVGPLQYGARSHWIVDIDPIGGHVRLENDMIWCIDPKDAFVFRSWAINDHVIMGTYDSWFSPYTHILINVNMDEHVKARQY